jgi:hypothetical protein
LPNTSSNRNGSATSHDTGRARGRGRGGATGDRDRSFLESGATTGDRDLDLATRLTDFTSVGTQEAFTLQDDNFGAWTRTIPPAWFNRTRTRKPGL